MGCAGYQSKLRRAAFGVAAVLTLACSPGYAQQKNGDADQTTFVMPSNNVECTYTPKGGTETYKPFDGGPELSCDRRDPKYIRVVLTPKSVKRFDDVGDQGCCGTSNPLPYGGRWSRGPFTCDSAKSGLTCKRSDGRGFVISRERVETF